MPDHYFTEKPGAEHAPRTFSHEYRGKTLCFETDAGVFSKAHVDSGTKLLLAALPDAFSGRALDLGCGWGAVGVCMASAWPGAAIAMTDINERAAALAAQNIKKNGLNATIHSGDGLSHLEGSFDLIAINPPIRAGKAVVYRLLEDALARLSPGGALYIVMRKQQGSESAKRFLAGLGAAVEVVSRGGGFHVLRAKNAGALPQTPLKGFRP